MAIEMLDHVVMTDYGQFDIVWGGFGFDGDFAPFFAGQVNGLVGAARGDGIYIHFARRYRGSHVRIVLLEQEPPEPGDQWEDVVEVSATVPAGATVGWLSWAGETGGALEALVPGSYRLRVSACGRDRAHARGAVDHYLLEFWAAAPGPDHILRTGSANALYWHREIGSRR